MQKYFIITVDTEGDNLWDYKDGDVVTTNNSKYIPRFQKLCEKYKFPPVYLSNYEMLCDDEYVSYIKKKHLQGLCEVGLHLHAWNNPPEYNLASIYGGNPYLIEYPDEVMHAKFDFLYNLFCEKMGFKPVSHRAGRWAMDDRYFKLLEEYGVVVDCSVTPHIDWSANKGATCGGTDYSTFLENPNWINRVFEIPPTIRFSYVPFAGGLRHKIKVMLCGTPLNFRLANASLKQMKYLINKLQKESSTNYLEFMLHSSELMPGGSPYFENEKAIEDMYADLEDMFLYLKTLGYVGCTLEEYYKKTNLNK